jgi:sialate O-acetylesterase
MFVPVSIRFASLAALLLVPISSLADSALLPASVFTDGMVLQREKPIPIWGTGDAGAKVEIQFGEARAACITDPAGHWLATLKSMPANSRSQSLVIRSGESKVLLTNVLVGDVWLCSGQSNMQMPLGDVAGGSEFAHALGNNPIIRLLAVPKLFTTEPSDSQKGRWTAVSPNTARQFSAVGISFGAALAESPVLHGVPLGLIDSSFGGTAIEAWIPADDLKPFDPSNLGNSLFGKPAEHYNAMVRPLIPLAIRGVLWYQGESNSDRPAIYGKLLDTMVRAWRREFHQQDLPFVVIQLPAYNTPFQKHFFTWIREQQALVAKRTAGVSLVVSYDTHDGSDLHPREKIPLGERAATAARDNVYRENLVAASPEFVSYVVDDAEARITFNTHGATLTTSDRSPVVRGFQLAGTEGKYRFATGKIVAPNTVVISVPEVTSPKDVRFAWGAVPNANLVSTAGLPAVPFRTDSYSPNDLEFVHVPVHRAVKTLAYELELDAFGSLRSLGVGGEQFISNDLGAAGGSTIPTVFGPRNLAQVEELSPSQLIFYDKEVSLSYLFDPVSVTIEINNRAADPLVYQISLAAGVTTNLPGEIGVRKGNVTLQATGFDHSPASESRKPLLKLTVPSKQVRTSKLQTAK